MGRQRGWISGWVLASAGGSEISLFYRMALGGKLNSTDLLFLWILAVAAPLLFSRWARRWTNRNTQEFCSRDRFSECFDFASGPWLTPMPRGPDFGALQKLASTEGRSGEIGERKIRKTRNFFCRGVSPERSDFASPPDWPVAHPDASGARLRHSTETSLYRGQSRRTEKSEHSELL